jgi:hypothetical protein
MEGPVVGPAGAVVQGTSGALPSEITLFPEGHLPAFQRLHPVAVVAVVRLLLALTEQARPQVTAAKVCRLQRSDFLS